MPEVHFIGNIVDGDGFDNNQLFCQWKVICDRNWELVRGAEQGQTQVDISNQENHAIWNHPINLQFSTSSIVGWPKFYVEVWRHDPYGKNEIAGYGMCHLPASNGHFEIDIVTWKPRGSWVKQLAGRLLGSEIQLVTPHELTKCSARSDLQTTTNGRVYISLDILHRAFNSTSL